MRSLTQRLAARLRRNQAGFTLVELLVVVGIIVALGAVIVPNVIQFSDSGQQGAQASEGASLQTAIDTMMADTNVTTVPFPASGTGNATQDFESGTAILDLIAGAYIRDGNASATITTQFFYCWDGTGTITAQDITAVACP